jgi:catechol 2,3-dioxygenase-like lactoylglutathione lyase family enzyme
MTPAKGAMSDPAMFESISAVTLATHDMARAVRFYRMLGFEVVHGGDTGAFTHGLGCGETNKS